MDNYIRIVISLFAITIAIPEYLTGLQPFTIIYKVAYYGYIIGIGFDLIKNHKIEKKVDSWIILYYFGLCLSTYFYSGMDISLFKSLIKTAIIVTMSINFLLIHKEYIKDYFFKICLHFGEIGIIVNLFFIIAYPNGIAQTAKTGEAIWLYGHKNMYFWNVFISVFASAIYFYDKKNRKISKRTLGLVGIILVSSVLSRASTTIVCSFVLLTLMIIVNTGNKKYVINSISCVIVPGLINISVYLFNIQYIFSFIIVNILNKDVTFSTRTTIWNLSMGYFIKNPIWGVGYLFSGDLYPMILLSETHSFIIGVLFHMGVVGVIIWLLALAGLIHKGNKLKKNQVTTICNIFIATLIIQGITENICAPVCEMRLFVILALCYKLPSLIYY